MSDFIYSKYRQKPDCLRRILGGLPEVGAREIVEFHGSWGSLALTKSIKVEFAPFETKEFICVLIGNPILKLPRQQANRACGLGTAEMLSRWKDAKGFDWRNDISGPFVALFVNKVTGELQLVTDILSFVPVFQGICGDNIILSTHIDCLHLVDRSTFQTDFISIAEFIDSGFVTFPYTSYRNVIQLEPASIYSSSADSSEMRLIDTYWLPLEKDLYTNIDDAAKDLYYAINGNINRVIDGSLSIAAFISGGEDSRFILGMLPKTIQKDAYVFLDTFNREGKIAKRAAEIYGANFHYRPRKTSHYADILPDVCLLVGSGAEYRHVHSYGFHKECNLDHYDAVFGGLFSDAFLKGARIKKVKGSGQLPFLPQIRDKNSRVVREDSKLIKREIMAEINKRQLCHYDRVKSMRPESADEWFHLWPISMNFNIPGLYGNRRLFNSYELFMTNEVVEISARVPQEWKLNRRLFHKMARGVLEKSKYLPHASGGYPYLPWQVNNLLRGAIWTSQRLLRELRFLRHDGPWGDWAELMKTKEWLEIVQTLLSDTTAIDDLLKIPPREVLLTNKFGIANKMNILQTLYLTKFYQ